MITKQVAKSQNRPSILNAYQLSKTYSGIYPIFQQVTFQLNQGEKVALVGVNGAGKSTLLKILAREEQADNGRFSAIREMKIAYLPQEATFTSDCTLYQEMLSVFT